MVNLIHNHILSQKDYALIINLHCFMNFIILFDYVVFDSSIIFLFHYQYLNYLANFKNALIIFTLLNYFFYFLYNLN